MQISTPPSNWLDRGQPNALNLLRLLFASSVIFSHAWALGGFGDEPTGRFFGPAFGGLSTHAVNAFFLISGFLITGSWLSGRGAESYLRARVGRIWPGFVVCLCLSAAIAAVGAGQDWLRYLRSIPIQSYIVGAFTLDWEILERPLSFPAVAYPHVVNGSMWTIAREFQCYLAVALVGSVGLFKRRLHVILVAGFSLAVFAFETHIHPERVWGHWSRFAAFFGAGAVFCMYRECIPRSGWLALACAVSVLAGWYSKFATHLVMPTAGAYLILFVAYNLPGWAQRIGAKNDISYGIYLYAFPLQQLYYHYARQARLPNSPWANFIFVLILSIGLGWLSWIFVERPAMRFFRRMDGASAATERASGRA